MRYCVMVLAVGDIAYKAGGYIMGHDYEMNMAKTQNVYHFGVKQAVDEFCATRGLRICAKGLDGCVSYAIRKEA